jgi:hypothetical protein
LIVGTHGRAIYVLDDITPLSALTPQVASSDLHVFPPRPALQIQRWKHESYSAQRVFAGPNPPYGAIVNYYVKSPGKSATLTISDASGATVRQLDAWAAEGINRAVWDLRSSAPAVLAGQRGPLVPPGAYSVTVRVGNHQSTVPLRVDPDPLLPMSDAERASRFTYLTDVLKLQADIAQAAGGLRGVRDQLTALQDQLKRQSAAAPLIDRAASLGKVLADLQSRAGGGGGGGGEESGGFGGGGLRGRVGAMFSQLDGSGVHQGTLFGPTASQRQQLEAARKEYQALAAEIDRALGADLTALNDEINRLKVPRIVRPQ